MYKKILVPLDCSPADEVVIVSVVGSGMSHTPGVAGRIFSALGADQVNVIAIAQGSSEVSISLVVAARSPVISMGRVV